MTRSRTAPAVVQSLSIDKFLYFFLGLRKGEIRRRVAMLKQRYPDDTPEQLARRVVAAQRPLSLLGGMLLELPVLLPGIGAPLKLVGVAGAASALVRMHMAMILEIALIHGFDIDDQARLKDSGIVLSATGLASATPTLARAVGLKSGGSMVAGTVAVSAVSELIGGYAIIYYQRRLHELQESDGEKAVAT